MDKDPSCLALTDSTLLYCDGASRGNPGPAGFGVLITNALGETLFEGGARLTGPRTNNEAEYAGAIAGLEQCKALGATRVIVHSDSQLLIRQLQGVYKVKAVHLQQLHQRATTLLRSFSMVKLIHIPREQNTRADFIANQALDGVVSSTAQKFSF